MKKTILPIAAFLLCALALGACTGTRTAEFTREDARVADPAPEQMRHAQAIIRIVNEFRTANGLPPVILEAHVMKAANDKALDFRNDWRFYHAGSDGSSPSGRVARTGYDWVEVGETLSAGQITARGAVANLKASPCHRFALLRKVYLHAGAAYLYAPDSPPGRYKHWWVVKLAQPSSAMTWERTYPTAGAELIERSKRTQMRRPPGCVIREVVS